jgi:hypothetical protein
MPLVRRGPGLIRGAARVGVAAGVTGRIQHRQQQRWAAEEQQAAQAQHVGEADYTAELEKLARLRDEGVISAEDFEAKKKQLLGI